MKFPATFRITLVLVMIAVVFTACSRDPNVRKQNYLKSGQRYFEKGKYREAEIQFVNALKIDPNYADAHYQLARSYIRSQRWGPAYQELARAVESQPENYPARIDMAKLLIASGNLKLAQEQTDLLLQKRPDDPAVHSLAASLLAAQADFSAAIAEQQKAIALDPGDRKLYLDKALLLGRNHQPDAAEPDFKKAVELNPQSGDAWLMLGTYHQARGRLGEAEQEIRRAIELDPKSLDARSALSRLYLAEGDKAKAVEILRQVKSDFPGNSSAYRMLGDFYVATGDLDHAVAEYAALYQQHPQDLAVKKNYVHLLMRENRWDQARKLNEEILKASPNDSEALLLRGQLEITGGDASAAIPTLQKVIKGEPNNAVAHYQLGLAFQKLDNLTNAESEWRDAVRLRPDLLEAQRSLALLAMRQGDMATLEQAAAQIIRLQPASPEGYTLCAISHINRQQFAAADLDISKAIAVNPQSHLGYVQRGNLKFVQKQYSEAAKAYQDALDRDPNSTDALRGITNTYLAQNQVDKALAIANAQIAKSPGNSSFYDLLGTLLVRDKRDLNGAEAAFSKSVELDRNNTGALIRLSQLQATRGEIDQAIATCQHAIQYLPNSPQLYTLLGQLYESKRDWAKAQEAYQQTLALRPGDPLVANNLANVLLLSGGNIDVAMSLAESARRGMPDSPDAADTLGWIYFQKGVYRSAISMFQEALKLQAKQHAGDNPDIHYHLGMTYLKTQQAVLARQQLELVLKINPGYAEAAEVKKQLSGLKS